MAADVPRAGAAPAGAARRRVPVRAAQPTETRPAFKTTELLAYIATAAGVLVAGAVADNLGARHVWLYVTILTVGYMVSRGLAKAGSYEHDGDADRDPA